MKKKIAINACLIIAVITILGVFAVYVRVGATADSVVVMRTTGMTCGSCVKKISKALQSERGVASTEVDLEGGWVIAGYDSKIVAADKLVKKVCDTGFGSMMQAVVTPAQFKQITGHEVGKVASAGGGCCGSKGCGGK